jgi:hypothetical protein
MALTVARFLSLLFVALSLAPSMAHVLELPHKIGMSAADYLIVQQIYRGWALLGIAILIALVSTLVLAILERHEDLGFGLSGGAFLCLVAAQVVFWTYTYPVNVRTQNWTLLPDNWTSLRAHWEYSHATGAAFTLLAFVLLVINVTTRK